MSGNSSYRGEVTIAPDTEERAATVTAIGRTLPIRYDPYDQATFVIDTVALGWGDPML